MIERNVFFLNKDDVIEFQNRCVIAVFLDTHSDISLIEYVDTNSFLGFLDGKETMIYLFSTPKEGAEAGIVYRSRNMNVPKSAHKYKRFSKQFLDNYSKYRGKTYEYIMNHFFSDWGKYHGSLFISKEPERKISFKYKQCVEQQNDGERDTAQLGKYFKDFLDGALVFSNPMTFNDPFDCDCNIPNVNSKINLLWNAFNSLKYSGLGSVNIKKEDIEKVLTEYGKKDNIREIICHVVEVTEKDKQIDLCKLKKNKMIDSVEENYKEMEWQLQNIKEHFRVFCTGDKYDDILMWGYYCNGGDGVCCSYDHEDIINSIITQRRECICVYGNVEYKDDKPEYRYTTTDLADNVLEYVMRCIFTKYTGWKHENEFRYVLIENDFEGNHIAVNSQVKEYYLGCKVSSTSNMIRYLASKDRIIKVLKKSADRYKLSCT